MLKTALVFILTALIFNNGKTQELDSFFIQNNNIKTWYVNKPLNEKIAIVNKLRNESSLEHIFKTYASDKEFYDWFSIIDFNHDGIDDIYYFGYSGAESKAVRFFECKCNGQFEKVFDVFGKMVSCNINDKKTNLIITVFDYPCCAGYVNVVEKYFFKQDNNKSTAILFSKEAHLDDTVFPKQLFEKAISFKTKNEKYKLRYEPKIKDEGKDEHTDIIGNIIAEYPKNSKGIALAEEIDQTSRKWWFVLMYNNITPLSTALYDGNNNESPYFSYGWMSNNFLEIIK